MSAVQTEPVVESTLQPSSLLAGKLAALRRKHVAVAVLTGLALAVAVCVEVLGLAMLLDWLVDFPWAFRVVLLGAQCALFCYIAWRFILKPVSRQPSDDELALLVERARPALRSRLITAIQLSRPGALTYGASPVLARETVRETEQLSHPIDFSGIVPTDRLTKLGILAAIVLAIAAAALAFGQNTTLDLLKRAFLSSTPVPRKTHVVVEQPHQIIGSGDSVVLKAIAQGIVPGSGKVEVKYRARRAQEYDMQRDKTNRTLFVRTIENVQDSFSYVVTLNDGRSETCHVKAIPRPTAASIECEQSFPAYTHRPPLRRALGDLSLLAGSIVKLKVISTKDVTTASIKLVGMQTNAPLAVNPQNLRELTGQFSVPAKGLTGFSVNLRDTEGMDSTDSAVYRIDVIPDKAPLVRLTYPDRKEELITRYATLLVGMEVSDDFQIAKLRLRYKVISSSPTVEITNLQAFVTKLVRKSDSFSSLLWEKLPSATRQSLSSYRGRTNEMQLLRTGLTDDLNVLANSGNLYDKDVFAKFSLATDTKELVAENPQGETLARLNRLLLRDAYPEELQLDDGVVKVVEMELTGQEALPLKRRYEWKIGAFSPLLAEGTKLEFWVEAEDNNNVTGPGIGMSEHQFAKVVSESEKRSDLLNRAGDYLGSISDVAGDQEKLNRNLGVIIREKSSAK